MIKEIASTIVRTLNRTGILSPRTLASWRYLYKFKRWPNIDHPSDFNEKVLWLMFNSDTSDWPRLADKYEVRSYVAECGLAHILPELYGVYDDVDQIDFATLPERCVIKTTSSCGSVLVYEGRPDAEKIDADRRTLRKWLKQSYGYLTAEPHYTKIKNRIIVEQLIEKDHPDDISLIDYKIWCFNGEPEIVFLCRNRNITAHAADFEFYTVDTWQPLPDIITKPVDAPPAQRPPHLAEMINYARILAKGFPAVRIDFYDSHGKVYFGEITLSSNGGRMRYLTDEALLDLGQKIILPR